MVPIPCHVRSRILFAIGEAERIKGRPANTPEIVVVFQKHSLTKFWNSFLPALMQNMYREDLYYADAEFVTFSLQGSLAGSKPERAGLELFSEKFRRLHAGYMLDKHMHIVAKPETPVLNLKQLMNLLKSKDENLW